LISAFAFNILLGPTDSGLGLLRNSKVFVFESTVEFRMESAEIGSISFTANL